MAAANKFGSYAARVNFIRMAVRRDCRPRVSESQGE
jgi:hypothetical protein